MELTGPAIQASVVRADSAGGLEAVATGQMGAILEGLATSIASLEATGAGVPTADGRVETAERCVVPVKRALDAAVRGR
jgi:hypothetical protein